MITLRLGLGVLLFYLLNFCPKRLQFRLLLLQEFLIVAYGNLLREILIGPQQQHSTRERGEQELAIQRRLEVSSIDTRYRLIDAFRCSNFVFLTLKRIQFHDTIVARHEEIGLPVAKELTRFQEIDSRSGDLELHHHDRLDHGHIGNQDGTILETIHETFAVFAAFQR
jgi:hypothetical protein